MAAVEVCPCTGGGTGGVAHKTLTSDAAGIEFTGLTQTYQHLYCVWSVRDDTNNYYGDGGMYFNSATGPSHPLSSTRCWQSGTGTGTSTRLDSSGGTAMFGFQFTGDTADDDTFSVGTAWILNYSTTGGSRPIILDTISPNNVANDTQSCMLAGLYGNTANAITAVRLYKQSGGDFLTGSTFTIYGVNSVPE